MSTWTWRYCTHSGTRSFSLTGHRIIEKYGTRESHGGPRYYLVLDTGSECARKSERQPRNDEKADIHEQDRQRKERGQECWLASNWIPSIYHSPPLHLLGPPLGPDSFFGSVLLWTKIGFSVHLFSLSLCPLFSIHLSLVTASVFTNRIRKMIESSFLERIIYSSTSSRTFVNISFNGKSFSFFFGRYNIVHL